MSVRKWILTLACAAPWAVAGAAPAAGVGPGAERAPATFGVLHAPTADEARSQARAWLHQAGKADAASLKKFDEIWAQTDRPLLERVAAVFELGNPDAAKLMARASDPQAAAPTEVPAVLKDPKQPAFFRANLALAYANALSNRRVQEESLEVLRQVKPDQVVDPASYFFHRAVAEHALLLKQDANRSVTGVLEDVADAPERYKLVSILMAYDMQSWRDKDLGDIARKMDNIERRLDLARGGPKTQMIQKDVVARLDEIIKKLENMAKGGGGC